MSAAPRRLPRAAHGVAFRGDARRFAFDAPPPRPALPCIDLRWGAPAPAPRGRALWAAAGPDGSARLALYRTANAGYALRVDCEGKGLLAVGPGRIHVRWEPVGTGPEPYLLGFGLALALEQRALPCLHASAVARAGRAMGFLGPSQAGKSTLAACLAARGARLVTDDMLVLHPSGHGFLVHPGTRRVRLWPDAVEHLWGAAASCPLARVHRRYEKRTAKAETDLGLRCATAASRVAVLYLLDPRPGPGPVALATLSRGDALLALLAQSLVGPAARAMGIEAERFRTLAAVARDVPVKRLTYPSGFARLPAVCEAVEADAAGLPSS